jgi:hypothetical protein
MYAAVTTSLELAQCRRVRVCDAVHDYTASKATGLNNVNVLLEVCAAPVCLGECPLGTSGGSDLLQLHNKARFLLQCFDYSVFSAR